MYPTAARRAWVHGVLHLPTAAAGVLPVAAPGSASTSAMLEHPAALGPCVPVMHGAAFHGGVVPRQGAMAMATTCVPELVPVAWPPRRHLEALAPRMQRAAAPGPASAATAASCGVKAAGDAKVVATTNQPSPRSVLVLAVPCRPISLMTSLPSSFPY